jgi:ABC-type iron transport system FetAB permease component
MSEESFLEKQEENIPIHIFSVSAALVGVCLTVVGLFSISNTLKRIESLGDEMIMFDAILFLISCITFYMALRTKSRKRRYILEKIADIFFLVGLSLMAIASVLIVRQFI